VTPAAPTHEGEGMIPPSDVDLYGGQTLLEPHVQYRALRDTGPVAWLTRLNVYAVSRYDDARLVLRDPDGFWSGEGVALNDIANNGGRVLTLASAGDTHHRFRRVIGRPMTPKALADPRPSLPDIADDLVDHLVSQGAFDAVTDLAETIPSIGFWTSSGGPRTVVSTGRGGARTPSISAAPRCRGVCATAG